MKKTSLFLAMLLIVVFALFAMGSSEDTSTTPAPTNAPSAQSTQTTPATEAEPTTETTGAAKEGYGVGEAAEQKGVTVTLLSVSESEGSTFNTPTEGNIFVICEFEIENNSKKELNISSMLNFEAYCDDYTCTYSVGALLEKGDSNQLDGTVAPGKKFKGIIGYEVPTDWQELEVHFTPDLFGKEMVFIANND